MKENKKNNNTLATKQSVDQAIWSACNILRRGNCASALQYVPELTWILFLRILDEREEREQQEAEALAVPFRASLGNTLSLARLGGARRSEAQRTGTRRFGGVFRLRQRPAR